MFKICEFAVQPTTLLLHSQLHDLNDQSLPFQPPHIIGQMVDFSAALKPVIDLAQSQILQYNQKHANAQTASFRQWCIVQVLEGAKFLNIMLDKFQVSGNSSNQGEWYVQRIKALSKCTLKLVIHVTVARTLLAFIITSKVKTNLTEVETEQTN